jgi:hypothetical protein
VPDVEISASANGGVALTILSADIVPAPLVSYAWATAKVSCPTACGAAASTPADTVTCKRTASARADCVANLGAKPATTTVCAKTASETSWLARIIGPSLFVRFSLTALVAVCLY